MCSSNTLSLSYCCCLSQIGTLSNLRQLTLFYQDYARDSYGPLTGLTRLENLEMHEIAGALPSCLPQLTSLRTWSFRTLMRWLKRLTSRLWRQRWRTFASLRTW